MNNKILAPMNLSFFIYPQGDSENQELCITGLNLYIYELLTEFPESIYDIKTEFIPIIAWTEIQKRNNYKKCHLTNRIISELLPFTAYQYSYNGIIKFNADIDKFQAIHNWYLKQIETSEIHWCSDTAKNCLQDWERILADDKKIEKAKIEAKEVACNQK